MIWRCMGRDQLSESRYRPKLDPFLASHSTPVFLPHVHPKNLPVLIPTDCGVLSFWSSGMVRS